ncbi:hypothetical protein Hamer_G027387 [Homarus americanus]|uniref:Uncharacterized protein n=1 Tax=Homarus americanus TaxID=6706 RepID=A0A8J5K0P9_HOMAM|nr:hypothetical protein Hamer_G027387 [Homarus americanus]
MLRRKETNKKNSKQHKRDDVKAGELTTRKLTEVPTTITRLSEQLQKEYDDRSHPLNLSALSLIGYGAIYGNKLICTDDDIEVLGDLLMEELPQDFEGFDAGVEEGAVTSPPCLEPINQPCEAFH